MADRDYTPDELQFIQAFGTPDQKAAAGLAPLAAPKLEMPAVLGTPSGQVYSPGQEPPAPVGPGVIGVDKRTDAERFKQAVADSVPQGAKDADKAFRQWLADHPLANWGVQQAPSALSGVMLPGGPLGAAALGAMKPKMDLPPPSGTTPAKAQPASPSGPENLTPIPNQPAYVAGAKPLPMVPLAPGQSMGGAGPAAGTRLGTDKGIQNAQNDVIAGQQALVDKNTELAGAKLAALDYAADAQSAAAGAKRIFAEHQKAVDDAVAKEQGDYEQKIADEREKASKLGIDPGRTFKNRSTGTYVAMAIGALASGALSGLQGTPNSFIDTLRGIVHDDIDSQDKDIQQAWRKVGGMQTTYENLVRRGVEKRAAQNAYLGQVLDSIGGELQARLQKAQLPAEKANLEAGIQSLQNQRSALDVQMQEYWKGIYDRRSAAAASAAAAAAERLWQHSTKLYELQTQRISAEKTGSGKGENDANLHEQLRSYEAALDGLDRMQQMIEGGGQLSAGRTAQGEALVAATANALARAETGGKRPPSEAEMSLLHKQLPADPNKYQWTSADLERIRTTRLKTIRDMNRVRADAGLPPLPEEGPKGVESVPGARPVQ